MKKILSLILAVLLLMTLALPVSADTQEGTTPHSHTITILDADEGHNYAAYQIFSGDVTVQDNDPTDDIPAVEILTNADWGSSVDYETKIGNLTLIEALQSAAENPNFYGYYANIPALNDGKDGKDEVTHKDQAEKVVEILSNNSSTEHALAFADIVNNYLKATSAGSADTVTTVGGDTGYHITGLLDGYYLIKDNADADRIPGDVKTIYILHLIENLKMAPKDSEVSVEKKIKEGESFVDACSNNMGDKIEFKITGELPTRLHEYETFFYEFEDTMSEGLTFVPGSVKLYTVNGDSPVLITAVKEDDDQDYAYEVRTVEVKDSNDQPTGETKLYVTIPDVRKIKNYGDYTVNGTTDLVMTYEATLNQNAVIGGDGNSNTVVVNYSNDPHADTKGTTPEDTVYVFTFQLDVTKYDGKTNQPLTGVEFVLYRKRAGQNEYAVLDNTNKITGWTPYLDQQAIDEAESKGTDTTNAVPATVLTSGEDGKFSINGVDNNATFFLKETKPLDHYSTIDDVEFTITGTYNAEKNTVDNFQITVKGDAAKPGNATTGVVAIAIPNNPGTKLPTTGGIGTTLFYVFGGLLVAAAVVLLITRKRMSNEN